MRGILAAGRDAILTISPEGARNVRRLVPDALLIFVMPPIDGGSRRPAAQPRVGVGGEHRAPSPRRGALDGGGGRLRSRGRQRDRATPTRRPSASGRSSRPRLAATRRAAPASDRSADEHRRRGRSASRSRRSPTVRSERSPTTFRPPSVIPRPGSLLLVPYGRRLALGYLMPGAPEAADGDRSGGRGGRLGADADARPAGARGRDRRLLPRADRHHGGGDASARPRVAPVAALARRGRRCAAGGAAGRRATRTDGSPMRRSSAARRARGRPAWVERAAPRRGPAARLVAAPARGERAPGARPARRSRAMPSPPRRAPVQRALLDALGRRRADLARARRGARHRTRRAPGAGTTARGPRPRRARLARRRSRPAGAPHRGGRRPRHQLADEQERARRRDPRSCARRRAAARGRRSLRQDRCLPRRDPRRARRRPLRDRARPGDEPGAAGRRSAARGDRRRAGRAALRALGGRATRRVVADPAWRGPRGGRHPDGSLRAGRLAGAHRRRRGARRRLQVGPDAPVRRAVGRPSPGAAVRARIS